MKRKIGRWCYFIVWLCLFVKLLSTHFFVFIKLNLFVYFSIISAWNHNCSLSKTKYLPVPTVKLVVVIYRLGLFNKRQQHHFSLRIGQPKSQLINFSSTKSILKSIKFHNNKAINFNNIFFYSVQKTWTMSDGDGDGDGYQWMVHCSIHWKISKSEHENGALNLLSQSATGLHSCWFAWYFFIGAKIAASSTRISVLASVYGFILHM